MDREALAALRAKIVEDNSFSVDDAVALVDLLLVDTGAEAPTADRPPKAKSPARAHKAEK